MKKIIFSFVALFIFFETIAQNSTGLNAYFVSVVKNDATSVKNQGNTGTCWSFSTTSLIESQALKNKLGAFDLSEMFTVRNIYIEKAKNYIHRQGHAQFSQGALGHDLIRSYARYGAMPESAYSGLMNGANTYNHLFLYNLLKVYLDDLLKKSGLSTIEDNWLDGYTAILDKYMGVPPAKFTYNNKEYTPISFAKEVLRFNADDYVNITSFSGYDYYKPLIIEAPLLKLSGTSIINGL